MCQHVYVIFYSGLEFTKVQTAVSKHVGIALKFSGGGNNARVWIKTASSATIIVCWVYNVMWCAVSLKFDGL